MCYQKTYEDLCLAIKTNNIRAIKSILFENSKILRLEFSTDLSIETRCNPLWEAMLCGHKEIVELLVSDFKADVDEPFLFERNEFFGLTFLQYLALQNDFTEENNKIAEILIRHGANMNTHWDDANLKSPLEVAIQKGNVEYVEFLLENDAKLKSPMKNLSTAPKIKQKEILKLIIEHKRLDPSLRNWEGANYLHIAIGMASIRKNLDMDIVGIVKTLLDFGVPVNGLDNRGRSPLFFNAYFQNVELVSILMERGADINMKSYNSGIVPLHIVAEYDNTKMIDLLLLNGAEINATCNQGYTALHFACLKRNEKTINFLLERGARIGLEDDYGKTPLVVLLSEKYSPSDKNCVSLMVKVMAKKYFFNDVSVCKKDIDLIHSRKILQELFERFTKELLQMSKTKFYNSYSYTCVLKMSKKIKKLANLAKNTDFVSRFEESLVLFSEYENELRKIWQEVVQVRDRL